MKTKTKIIYEKIVFKKYIPDKCAVILVYTPFIYIIFFGYSIICLKKSALRHPTLTPYTSLLYIILNYKFLYYMSIKSHVSKTSVIADMSIQQKDADVLIIKIQNLKQRNDNQFNQTCLSALNLFDSRSFQSEF